uniref:ATP-dependent Clp protease proteolytic subunit n=1 Tax=Mammillaria huitzilopochtli TaxID=278535 RepID=A0A5J6VC85_9CARY|nr:clp protease proteolytic subunit [Mammillaria huitzilopochtli]
MPISFDLPMVPVTLPGDEEEWIDIDEELCSNKILFLCDELDDEVANDIMTLMIFFDMEEDIRPFYLFINSPGGDVINGMAIDNVIQFTRSTVMTICLGIAASMASYILAGGSQKKRVALPHARIMIHEPFIPLEHEEDDDVNQLYAEFEEVLIIRETLARGYSERTDKPLWIIYQDMETDIYMSAKEAQAYGIVDRVGI